MAGHIIRMQSEISTHTDMCWVPEYIQQKKEGDGAKNSLHGAVLSKKTWNRWVAGGMGPHDRQ